VEDQLLNIRADELMSTKVHTSKLSEAKGSKVNGCCAKFHDCSCLPVKGSLSYSLTATEEPESWRDAIKYNTTETKGDLKLDSSFHRHRCIWVCYKDITLGKYCQTGVIIEPMVSFRKIAKFVALASYSQSNVMHGSSVLTMEANTRMESYLKKSTTSITMELKVVIILGCVIGLCSISIAVYRLLFRDKGKHCEDDARNLLFLGAAGCIIMLFVCEYVRTKTKVR
jgi:hypothetical protein